jgi:hypothetical protein
MLVQRFLPVVCFVAVLCCAGASLHAAPDGENPTETTPLRSPEDGASPPASCSDSPWVCGVTELQQQEALALYREANQLFDDGLFVGAAGKYRAALEHWDHPAIHYNLMLALVALDRPIEAYESSLAALRHGPTALPSDDHKRARDYQKLLRGQIAVLEVICDEPGAIVSLDGRQLFGAPGMMRLFVLPGQHELVARKTGFLASHQTLLLLPEEPLRVHVAMLEAGQALLTLRHWQPWRPWGIVGAGVGIGLLGAAFEWRADVNNRATQELFHEECPPPLGCFEQAKSPELVARTQRSTWYRRMGHGASIAGTATALTGLVLVYLNRPQQIENPLRKQLVRVSIVPAIDHELQGISLRLTF